MKFLIFNWKMYLDPKEEIELARKLRKIDFDKKRLTVCIHPTFVSLQAVGKTFADSAVVLGAQDCFYEDKGAYTGEVSPYALKNVGCSFVILGHSERRRYYRESDETINKKTQAAINNHLTPVICVGEQREDRDAGNKDHIVRRQVEAALEKVALVQSQELFIAYEPVWAIGTDNPATLPEVSYMHKVIYQTLVDVFSASPAARNTRILYGGSVNSVNLKELLEGEAVDGVLVGGASVRYEECKKMIEIAGNL